MTDHFEDIKDFNPSMEECHIEEERMMNHLKSSHNLNSDFLKNVRNCCTYHAVYDLWKFHDELE